MEKINPVIKKIIIKNHITVSINVSDFLVLKPKIDKFESSSSAFLKNISSNNKKLINNLNSFKLLKNLITIINMVFLDKILFNKKISDVN